MKKKLASLLTACLASSVLITSAITPPSAYAADKINVELNGSPLQTDQDPFVHESRTFVPLRAIFEALGASIQWDAATRTVTSTKGDVTIKLTIGNKIAYRNDAAVELDAAPMVRDERSFVPVRFIAESFNTPVEWDAATKTVRLLKSNRAELEKILSERPNSINGRHVEFVGNYTARDQNFAVLGTRIGSIDLMENLETGAPEFHATYKHLGAFFYGANDFELYSTNNRAYVQFKGASTWQTSSLDAAPNISWNLIGPASQPPLVAFPLKYAKYAVLSQTDSADIVTFYVTPTVYTQMHQDIGVSTSSQSPGTIIKLSYTLNKETHVATKVDRYIQTKREGTELFLSETYNYSKYNQTFQVTLPTGAKNATEANLSQLL